VAGRAESLTKPPCTPAIASHPALPSAGTGFWSGRAAGVCFNIWDLEKTSHDHNKQERVKNKNNFKSAFSLFSFPSLRHKNSQKEQMTQKSATTHTRGKSKSCPERRGL